jgi:(E)-4-hydroxy-3-methylbut-2-enyl-diphosphate synthase
MPLSLGASAAVGPEQPPRVIVPIALRTLADPAFQSAPPALKDTPAEGLLVRVESAGEVATLKEALARRAGASAFLAVEVADSLTPADVEPLLSAAGAVLLVRRFGAGEASALAMWTELVRRHSQSLACDTTAGALRALLPAVTALGDAGLVFTCSEPAYRREPYDGACTHAVGDYRALAQALREAGSRAPIWIRNTAATAVRGDNSFLSKLLEASFLTGALLCDGVGDLVSIETEADFVRAAKLAYNVLQGAGARISKTEFVACPSCGRTLFDLQSTTQRIRERTGHLKGVKIAILGCIVNGPGEMADADFGYVGGAPGKINLYVGKACVQYNIPEAEADARLVALIREHGKWMDPEPAAVAS